MDPTGRVQCDKCSSLEYQILRGYIVEIFNFLCLSIKFYYIQFPIIPLKFGLSYAKTVLMLLEKIRLKGTHSPPVKNSKHNFSCVRGFRPSATFRRYCDLISLSQSAVRACTSSVTGRREL